MARNFTFDYKKEFIDATIVDEHKITPPSVVETEFVPGSIHSERVRDFWNTEFWKTKLNAGE